MLSLHRLRLLKELGERGTIAAVADALAFTPSAVSQQLAVLEREAGTKLFERVGRGVRLTDAGVVLSQHAATLLEGANRAEADLAALAGEPAGVLRVAAFQWVAARLVMPAIADLAEEAPDLRCEVTESEPEESLPALLTRDIDIAIVDEWEHQPLALAPELDREDLLIDPVYLVLPKGHPCAAANHERVALSSLADEPWAGGHVGMAWTRVITRTCRERAGFDPDLRYRTNDSVMALEATRQGLAVTMLPGLIGLDQVAAGDDVKVRAMAEGPTHRKILVATRSADRNRPSIQAMKRRLAAARDAIGEMSLGSGAI